MTKKGISMTLVITLLLLFELTLGFPRNQHLQQRTSSESVSTFIAFEDCGSIYDVLEVNVSSCESSPCRVTQGETVSVTTEFNPTDLALSSTMNHQAYWKINNLLIDASITPEACDGEHCPFVSDDGLAFTAYLYIDGDLPTVKGSLYWKIKTDSGTLLMCIRIPMSITGSTA